MMTETIYYICKICNQGVTKDNLSNGGMLNKTCRKCIPIRDDMITKKYDELRKTMHQYPALDIISNEQNLVPESILKIIINTRKKWRHGTKCTK